MVSSVALLHGEFIVEYFADERNQMPFSDKTYVHDQGLIGGRTFARVMRPIDVSLYRQDRFITTRHRFSFKHFLTSQSTFSIIEIPTILEHVRSMKNEKYHGAL